MNQPRILVLDDDKSIRSFLADLFVGQGYHVTQAATGEDALCEIQAERFDLAMIDFNLPGWVDGIDFLKEVKSLSPWTEVILLTGNASEEVAREALRHGVYHYYIKPLQRVDLFLRLVAQALEHGRGAQSSSF